MKVVFQNTKICFLGATPIDPSEFVLKTETIKNPEFSRLVVDSSNKVIWGRYSNGEETNIDIDGTLINGVPLKDVINKLK